MDATFLPATKLSLLGHADNKPIILDDYRRDDKSKREMGRLRKCFARN